MSKQQRAILAVANAVGLAVALTCNSLANALPLNGMDTGELSALYPNLFVPAGVTFAIWGLIYAWLLAFVGYGFVLIGKEQDDNPLGLIGPWFVVNTLANAAWIFAWHWQQVPLSLAIMGVLLASLVAMYERLGVGRGPVSMATRLLVHAPISVYLGWITVATIANVTTLAVDMGAPAFGPGPAAITAGVVATAVLIALRMLQARRDVAFGGVVAWALLGIYFKRATSTEEGTALVATAALIGLGALTLGLLATAWRILRAQAEPE